MITVATASPIPLVKTANKDTMKTEPTRSMKTKGATPNMNFQFGLSSFSFKTLAEKNRFKEFHNREKKLVVMPRIGEKPEMESRIYNLLYHAPDFDSLFVMKMKPLLLLGQEADF